MNIPLILYLVMEDSYPYLQEKIKADVSGCGLSSAHSHTFTNDGPGFITMMKTAIGLFKLDFNNSEEEQFF